MKRLNGWDAMLLYSETENVPAHTLKIMVIDATDFDGEFGFDVFRDWVRAKLPALTPLRYKLVEVPYKLHHPLWLDDAEVDLDHHLRRARVPSPGGRRELDQTIATIAGGLLDRDRPLWEMHFLEGMADNRFAVVFKLHHALADGVAAANLIAHALDVQDGERARLSVAALVPTRGSLLWGAARDHLHQVGRLPALVRATAEGVTRLRRRTRERGEQPDLAESYRAPRTFLNHPVSSGRCFATASLPLAEIKKTSKHFGLTINDIVLATTAGALRQLLIRHGGHADEPIIASVPTTLDASPDRLSGNELSAMSLSLPVHIADPVERLRLISLATSIAKEDIRLLGPTVLESWVAYLPPALSPPWYRWRSKREARHKLLNLPVSNVPGPRQRGEIAGATVSEIYSVGPLVAGCAMNITVWSYADQLNISVLTDDSTLADTHEATDAMVDAFAEIRDAAGIPAETAQDARAMAPAHAAG